MLYTCKDFSLIRRGRNRTEEIELTSQSRAYVEDEHTQNHTQNMKKKKTRHMHPYIVQLAMNNITTGKSYTNNSR